MKKAFLVTGLPNSLGGHEDHLIRNDDARKEIEEIFNEVSGEGAMGFQAPNDQSDDPFKSDDNSSDIDTDEQMQLVRTRN